MSGETNVEQTQSDYSLLRAYVDRGDEAAFSELVSRYVGMVHASALRQTSRSDLAEDIVQAVFILLARKAATFDPQILLGGWLFRSVRFAANDLLKAERRRQFRETVAYTMKEQADKVTEMAGPGKTDDDLWKQVAPEIDGCLGQLGETDRMAILLRFFEEKSFPEVGAALRLSEEAARKRVNRALEKLQSLLQRRGLTASALGLSTLLSTQAASSVSAAALPAGLGSKVAVVALAAQAGTAAPASAITLAQSVATKWAWVQAKAWLWGAGTVAAVGTVAGVLLTQLPSNSDGAAGVSAGRRDDYRVAGFPDATRVHAVIAELQAAVARGDAKAVAARVRFPLRLNSTNGVTLVPDAATFIAEFSQIFPPEVRSALAKCPRSALFSSTEGVMIGSGDLWLAPAAPDNADPRLAAINLKVAPR